MLKGEFKIASKLIINFHTRTMHIIIVTVAVNFHQRWVFFSDLSLKSWSIYMTFCKHSLQVYPAHTQKISWNLSKYFKK